MAEFDRDAVIDEAQQVAYNALRVRRPSEGQAHHANVVHAAIPGTLPVIVAAALAPIEVLHSMQRAIYQRRDALGDDYLCEFQFCRGCNAEWPCPTAQAIADTKAKAGVPCPD